MKCYARAVLGGAPVDSDCLQRASDRFNAGWTETERSGVDCLTSGDEGGTEADVDDFISELASALAPQPGPNGCSARKLTLAGKNASGRAKCHAKAVARGRSVDGACLQQAATRFGNAWAKAETVGSCLTSGDRGTIEIRVDDFVDGLRGALVP